MNVPSTGTTERFRVIAIMAAFNEGDVIYHVIGDLVENGVEVYLIDNCSTDNTVEEASRWLGKGLVNIERFPVDAAAPSRANHQYAWGELLRRKEELAVELDASWFIHADGDEFRESLWPGMRLADAIRLVDHLCYNAIQFEVLNFRPVDDRFVPGDDVREYLTAYEPPDSYDVLQIKAWKKCDQRPHLAESAGHDVRFVNRRVFPFRFPLRHYPIRSSQHGLKKVFHDRLPRFMPEELAVGWHVQYDRFRNGSGFLWKTQDLREYDAYRVRKDIVERTHDMLDGRLTLPEQGCPPVQPLPAQPEGAGAEELCRHINDAAGFLRMYNLASALEKAGNREVAAKIFSTLQALLHTLNQDLAGKASYKLALLTEDPDLQMEHLKTCLNLLPSHRAARAMLTELKGRSDGSTRNRENGI